MNKQKKASQLPQRAIDCLTYYFKHDTWTVHDALCLLSGINPDRAEIVWEKKDENGDLVDILPEVYSYHPFEDEAPIIGYDDYGYPVSGHNPLMPEGAFLKLHDVQERLRELKKLWDSKLDGKTDHPPSVYIQWALDKGQDISWLDWVRVEGYWVSTKVLLKHGVLQDSDHDHRSDTSLLKIIAGLMHSKFPDIDCGASRLTGLNKVQREMSKAGIKIDDDTLKKWLNAADVVRREALEK